MDKATQKARAISFLAMHHRPSVLFLPNVWDAMSARLFAEAGFEALATTSGGVAWALGYPDGEKAPWSEIVGATARIVRGADVSVSADIEGGYGDTPEEIGAHVGEIIRTGAVGVNLEDGAHEGLRDIDDMVARLRAARSAADLEKVPIVINARCDVFQKQAGNADECLGIAIDRCNAYFAAGADCVYPFGLRDTETIAKLVKAVRGPVNITGRPGLPGVNVLGELGVARITIASAPTLVAMDAIQTLASSLRANQNLDVLSSNFHRPEAQRLFGDRG